MSIAEDIIDGWCCQLCGVYFEEEHGTLLFAKAATTNYQKKKRKIIN
jgi:rubredoxin